MSVLKFLKKGAKFLTKVYNVIVKLKLDVAIIREAWGKIAGNVISFKGDEVKYLRKTYKDSCVTDKQRAWRNKYHVVDIAFKDLTDEQKAAWRKFAPTRQNEYSYFMQVNLKRAAKGLPVIMWPPEMQGGYDG